MSSPDTTRTVLLGGKYELHEQIGEGGMNTVVEATDTTLGRKVAIKFVRSTDSAESAERLRREAVAVAQLRSDHIVSVYETGFTEDVGVYLVMERLQGFDLRKQIRDGGALPVAEAVHYALQVCEGLAHAHAAKIVHRDVKPSNMFVALAASGKRTVKLLDFGIALNRGADQASNLTRDAVLGSPNFMAPEQIRSPKNVDARSDIWSLGVSLYQMLSGKLPFTGENLTVLTLNICEEDAPSLSSRNVQIPPGLDACIQRCLRKAPRNRYPSVLELAEALAPFGTKEVCSPLLASIQHVAVGAMASVVAVPPKVEATLIGMPADEGTLRDPPPTMPSQAQRGSRRSVPSDDAPESAPGAEETLLGEPPSIARLRAMKTADFRESTVPMPGEQERVARAQAAALLAERSGSGPRVQTKPIAISTPVRVSSAPQLHDSYPGSAGQMSEAPLDTGRLRLYIVLGVVGTAFLLIVLASLSALFAHP